MYCPTGHSVSILTAGQYRHHHDHHVMMMMMMMMWTFTAGPMELVRSGSDAAIIGNRAQVCVCVCVRTSNLLNNLFLTSRLRP